jgi:hypothetical protein
MNDRRDYRDDSRSFSLGLELTAGGQTSDREFAVPYDTYATYRRGDRIDVVYDRQNPTVFMPGFDVEGGAKPYKLLAGLVLVALGIAAPFVSRARYRP